MRTLKEIYDSFREQSSAPSQKQVEPVAGFSELLARDMGPLFGISHEIYHIKRVWIPDCARNGLHVLISGETGTGKDLVARSIHQLAARMGDSEIPFVRFNARTVSPDESDAELFGRGSGDFSNVAGFVGGLMQQAEGGTLFIDNIDALPEPTLAKLMGVLQRGEYSSISGGGARPLRARLVGACNNRELLPTDAHWRFPEHIYIPPLRQRRLDIFFALFGLLNQDAEKSGERGESSEWLLTPTTFLNLLFSPWRGNVGELKNSIDTSRARYRNAPDGVPRFFSCRSGSDAPDVLTRPTSRYDLWRHLSRFAREDKRGAELIPAEPPERGEVNDFSIIRSLGTEDIVPCLTLAEGLELATIIYEMLDEDSSSYEAAEARVYTAEASRPPLPPVLRWQYDNQGKLRPEDERWAVDFSAMTAEAAYAAYLQGLRERCPTMSEAVDKSGLSDSTLRRHFKDHGIRQYKGRTPGR